MQIKYKTTILQHYTHLEKASSKLKKQETISKRDDYEFKGIYEKNCKNRLSLAIRTLANTFFSIGLTVGCSKKAKENWQKVKENWRSVFTGKTRFIIFTQIKPSNQSIPKTVEKTQTTPAVISLKKEDIKPAIQEKPLSQEKKDADPKQENPSSKQNKETVVPPVEIKPSNASIVEISSPDPIESPKIEGKVLSQDELQKKWTKQELEEFLRGFTEKKTGDVLKKTGDVVFCVNNQQVRWTQSLKDYLLNNLPTETIKVGENERLEFKATLGGLLSHQKMTFQQEDNNPENDVCWGFEREILIKNSSFFETLWNGNFKEANSEILTIKGISVETFKNMLCIIHRINSKYLVDSFKKFDINQWIVLLQFANAFEFNKNIKEIICAKIEQLFSDLEEKSLIDADIETCVQVYQLVTSGYQHYEKIGLRSAITERLDKELSQKTKEERVQWLQSIEKNYGVELFIDLFGNKGLDRKYFWEFDISWLVRLYSTSNVDSWLKIDIRDEISLRLLSRKNDKKLYEQLINELIQIKGMPLLINFFVSGSLNINYLSENQMTSIYDSYKSTMEELSIEDIKFRLINGKTKEEKVKNLTYRLVASYFSTAFNQNDIPNKFQELMQALNKFEKVFPDINLQNYKASLDQYDRDTHFLIILLCVKEALQALSSADENKLQQIDELMKNLNPFGETPDHAIFGKTLAAQVKEQDLGASLDLTKNRQRMTIGFLEEILASNNKERIQIVFKEYLGKFTFNPQEISDYLRLKDPYAMSGAGCLVFLEKIDTLEKLKWILEVVPSQPAELKQEILKKFKTWHHYNDFGTQRLYQVSLSDEQKHQAFQEAGVV